MNQSSLLLTGVCACALFANAQLGQAQSLLLQYGFNEGTGTTAANSGSASSANVTMRNSAGTATDLFSSDQAGVSGLVGDFALDLTSAAGMGSANGGNGPRANNFTDPSSSLESFTVSGWFRSGTVIGNSARLVDLGGGDLQVFSSSAGNLVLSAGGSSTVYGGTDYNSTNEWVFFAATFDGTALEAERVNFYIGDTTNSVSLVGTLSNPSVSADPFQISLGNSGSGGTANQRPYDGLLDDIRLYGETIGGTGALSLAQLETVRAAALVPEPSAVLPLMAAAGFMLWMRRPIRRRS